MGVKDEIIILTNEFLSDGFNLLKEKGIKTFHSPMIKTYMRIDDESLNIHEHDFLIFTSKNGVKYFFQNNFIKKQNPENIKAISIGSKTENLIKEYKVENVYTAKKNYSDKLSIELKKTGIINSKKVLLVQGNLAKNKLSENLKKFCYLTKFVAYNTEIIKQKNKQLEKLLNIANTFTVFTSPSCFESFINLYDPNKTNIISIGDSTSSYIKSVGYSPLITSKMQTYEGISNSIISYFKNINDDISKNKA